MVYAPLFRSIVLSDCRVAPKSSYVDNRVVFPEPHLEVLGICIAPLLSTVIEREREG